MSHMSILPPLYAMLGLTFLVWLRMYFQRVGELRARRIPPQAIATSGQAAETLKQVNAADNFRNLFEVPVLFYALCLLAYSSDKASSLLVSGAWLFVSLRALHSLIQCTYNRVTHRFAVYVASTSLLWLMWGALGLSLLGSQG